MESEFTPKFDLKQKPDTSSASNFELAGDILKNNQATAEELEHALGLVNEELKKKFEESKNVTSFLAIREYCRSIYDQGDAELGTTIWKRLSKTTDIVDAWLSISPKLHDVTKGVFLGKITELNDKLGINITTGVDEKNLQNAAAGVYVPAIRAILTKNDGKMLHHLLLDVVKSISNSKGLSLSLDRSFSEMGLIGHELSHDSTSSLQLYRKINKSKIGFIDSLSILFNTVKRRIFYGKRNHLHSHGVIVSWDLDYTTRSSGMESELSEQGLWQFVCEVIARLAEVDIGARVYSPNEISAEILNPESKSYAEAKQVFKENKVLAAAIEKKIALLSDAGLKATEIAIFLRNSVLSEYENNLKLQMSEFVTEDLVVSLLDSALEHVSRARKPDVSSLIAKSKLRKAMLSMNALSACLEKISDQSPELKLIMSDEVSLHDYDAQESSPPTITMTFDYALNLDILPKDHFFIIKSDHTVDGNDRSPKESSFRIVLARIDQFSPSLYKEQPISESMLNSQEVIDAVVQALIKNDVNVGVSNRYISLEAFEKNEFVFNKSVLEKYEQLVSDSLAKS